LLLGDLFGVRIITMRSPVTHLATRRVQDVASASTAAPPRSERRVKASVASADDLSPREVSLAMADALEAILRDEKA